MLEKHSKKKEKRRHGWEQKLDSAASLTQFVRLSSVETASHAWWFLTSATGWNPCAELQKLPGTDSHFLTGFRQRAENVIFCQQATVTKASL